MDNQLVQILENTVSPNQHELTSARDFLENAITTQYQPFIISLSQILSDVTNKPVVRMQAGLQLKNVIYSNETEQKAINQSRWLNTPPEIRHQIKVNCFNALGTQEQGFHSAAQCVAYIACAEIPSNQWPDVMQLLVQNITGPSSTETLKQASLEAIGYICNDIDPSILATQADQILTGIIYGMKKEEPSYRVKLAATQALLNSLEFTRHNFDNENERNYIMQVVCESTQCSETSIAVVALQCLVKIMSQYYMYMELYMQRALFAITVEAMRSSVDAMVLQGIEFWSTVCEEEIDIALELAESQEHGIPSSAAAIPGGGANISKYYARGAVKFLVPLLLDILEKQDEGDDEDEWNPHKAAGVCMTLLSQACEGDIVELVLPYVQANIRHEDWKRRDAAVMAFGSILEGPSPRSLEGLVTQAMPVITELLADPISIVRDTAAWTVGRVCEVLPEVPLGDACLPGLLSAMMTALSSEAKVATNVCWAFSSLAEGAYTVEMRTCSANPDGGDGSYNNEPVSYKLSPYFSNIVEQLLRTTNRADCGQSNLRNAAYSALMEMVKSAPKDCYACIQQTTLIVLEKLNGILLMDQASMSSQDRMQLAEYQSLLCGTLQSVLRKIERSDAQKISDQIMEVLMLMFERTQINAFATNNDGSTLSRYTGVQEDALIAVNALIDAIGPAFSKYLAVFMNVLIVCLQNVTEQQICSSAVGILGDLARSVTLELVPYLGDILMILFNTLRHPSTQRSLLPLIISAFGDFALLLGDAFAQYRLQVLQTLKDACQAEVDLTDPDMIDYLNGLRLSCIEAFVGLIQGAKSQFPQHNIEKLQFIIPHMTFIINFMEHIGAHNISSEELIGACCGLVGDIAIGFGKDSLQILDTDAIRALLTRGRNFKNANTKKYAVWAVKELTKLRNM